VKARWFWPLATSREPRFPEGTGTSAWPATGTPCFATLPGFGRMT
jgi:hypothetical protein